MVMHAYINSEYLIFYKKICSAFSIQKEIQYQHLEMPAFVPSIFYQAGINEALCQPNLAHASIQQK